MKEAIFINEMCRKHNIKFILADCKGVFFRVFNDFGENFTVIDKDGEALKEIMIKSISESGDVEVLGN
jgi:molybdopterin/thiamine biosynthesis adenylyltransferase